jgi:diketogulonate reductase-like aldo/keto reductase
MAHLPEPHLGMGTWGMGGRFEQDSSNVDESIEAIQFGISHGLKIIDVAELYGAGLAEEIVGKAIIGHEENIYIISKVERSHLGFDDVLKAAEGSLKRLNLKQIDLYLVHKPNDEIPLSETMKAMERLIDEGKVKSIGVSNFSVELMEEAQSYLSHTKIIANQFEYNLYSQQANADIIPYCKGHNIDMIAYRPFAKGFLTGNEDNLVLELAKKYKKTPNQIALNWIISQNIIAIPKSSNKIHLMENIGALGWQMSPEDIDRLRALNRQ